jgi:hypothetical protein
VGIEISKKNNSRSKAIGERIIANELTYRDWLVVNANSGEQNAPNLDLIAIKDNKRITIQVKSCDGGNLFLLGWGFNKDKKYFNTRVGPKADFIATVIIETPSKYKYLILPVKKAEEIAREYGKFYSDKPKKNGDKRSDIFPININIDSLKDSSLLGYFNEKGLDVLE